jgi:hypothetical protein
MEIVATEFLNALPWVAAIIIVSAVLTWIQLRTKNNGKSI